MNILNMVKLITRVVSKWLNMFCISSKSRQDNSTSNRCCLFDEIPEAREDANNGEYTNQFKILYNNPILASKAEFILTNKSVVRDLHRLNPRFLDVNMRVEIPVMTTSFAANFIFEIVKKLCEEFDFYVYNEHFKDVIELRMPTVIRSFEMTKEAFKEKYNYLLDDIYFCPKDKLNDILKYVNEQYSLQRYYRDQEVYVLTIILL